MSEQTITRPEQWHHYGYGNSYEPARITVGERSTLFRSNGAVALFEENDCTVPNASDVFPALAFKTITALAELPRPTDEHPFSKLRAFAATDEKVVPMEVKRVGVCGRHVDQRQLAFALSHVDAETVSITPSAIKGQPGLLIERADSQGPWWRLFIMGTRPGRAHKVFPKGSPRGDTPVPA